MAKNQNKSTGFLSKLFRRPGKDAAPTDVEVSLEVSSNADAAHIPEGQEDILGLQHSETQAGNRVEPTLPLEEEGGSMAADADAFIPEPASVESHKKRFSLKALFRKHSNNDFSFEEEDDSADIDEMNIRPIRILIGYIPDVTEKDARYFAAGIAERNVESPYIGYFSLFRYGSGYAYEIQEGGTGRSLLDPVLQYYKGLPYGQCDRETAVFIRTSQRMVQIEKSSDGGLICVQLPESSTATETEWLKPTKKLKLLRDLNTGFMVASGAFLGLTFIALAAAFASRYQPYEQPPVPKQDKVNISDLPSSRWYQVESPGEGHYVKTWQFKQGKWQTPELGNFAPPAPPESADKKAATKEKGGAAPLPLPPVPLPIPGQSPDSSKGPK